MASIPRSVSGVLVGVALAAAAHATPARGLADLTALFAPPTQAELAAVRADWASRPLAVEGYRLEATGTDSLGDRVHILSHVVDGQRHFGALRFPQSYVPGGSYPLYVVCHGGLSGANLDEVEGLFATLPGQCVESDAFLLLPSYRGEDLVTSFAGTFASGGNPSWADRDVDDTMALLSAALLNYPEIDDARIGAFGISRGGAVALLMHARDPRVRRVIDLFAFTDLSLPSVRTRLDAIQNQGVEPTGIGRVAWESAVLPWLMGTMTLGEARLAWIRRSPSFFAADMRAVQAHHGLADTQVDSSHTATLLDALAVSGLESPDLEGFYYPGGLHGLSSLAGYGDRAEPYMCALLAGPRGYCGPMTPNSDGTYASATFSGSTSLTRNDFVFRATGCRPSTLGLVFVSPRTAYIPSGAGYLCLGPGLQRLGLGVIDGAGNFSLPVDFSSSTPNIAPFFGVGQDVYFQVVYRDMFNVRGYFNFSNGLAVTLRP